MTHVKKHKGNFMSTTSTENSSHIRFALLLFGTYLVSSLEVAAVLSR